MMILDRGGKCVCSVLVTLLVGCLLLCSCGRADLSDTEQLPQTFVEADTLYKAGRYEQAAKMYDRTAEECSGRASLQSLCYYRAGVAYSQTEQRGWAILSYRKALLLTPDYKEARHNLRLAEEARMNMPAMEYPIVRRWADACAYALPMSGWLVISIVLFVGAVVTCLAFFLGRSRRVRRTSFYAMLILLLLWGCTLLMILHRRHYDKQTDVAVVCSVKAPLYALEDDPAVAEPVTELYDGAELRIASTAEGGSYLHVVLPDGTEGWLPKANVEPVAVNQ